MELGFSPATENMNEVFIYGAFQRWVAEEVWILSAQSVIIEQQGEGAVVVKFPRSQEGE